MPSVLIIDDERAIRSTLREILEFEKYVVDEAADGQEGLSKLREGKYDVALCDIKMPKTDGMEVLEAARTEGIDTQFIMITAHGTIETAVEATKKGAYDFITKPPDLNRLLVAVRNALEKTDLVAETQTLRTKVSKKYKMIGSSKSLDTIRHMIDRVGPTEARVLITGPNGAGKELVAQAIHNSSTRNRKKMIEVNCAAIPSELIESELFGHEKGAFTSANKQRTGRFEQANGSTIFLDEIGDMSLSAQAKVLRALQENTIMRVGGDKLIKVDVRVVAATNKDLQKEIAEGNFREDLYHRLSVIIIEVPPLNNRTEDIPELTQAFLEQIADETGTKPCPINEDAVAYLQTLDWTGNVRQLRNVVERLVIMADDVITLQHAKNFAGLNTRT